VFAHNHSFVKWQKVYTSDENKIEVFEPSRKTPVQTQHLSSPQRHDPNSEAWLLQHHAMGMLFISRDWETGQN